MSATGAKLESSHEKGGVINPASVAIEPGLKPLDARFGLGVAQGGAKNAAHFLGLAIELSAADIQQICKVRNKDIRKVGGHARSRCLTLLLTHIPPTVLRRSVRL